MWGKGRRGGRKEMEEERARRGGKKGKCGAKRET